MVLFGLNSISSLTNQANARFQQEKEAPKQGKYEIPSSRILYLFYNVYLISTLKFMKKRAFSFLVYNFMEFGQLQNLCYSACNTSKTEHSGSSILLVTEVNLKCILINRRIGMEANEELRSIFKRDVHLFLQVRLK